MFKKKFIITVVLLSTFCPGTSFSQEIPTKVKEISLQEVSDIALQNNFDIQFAKYDIQISRQDINIARSIYDVMFDAEMTYADDQLAKNSALLSTHSTSRDYGVGLSKKFPSGTTLSIDQDAGRDSSSLSSLTYNPVYESKTTLTIEQDLGRNFFGIKDRGNVKVAMKDVENAEFISFSDIEAKLAAVQKSYWNLVLRHELFQLSEFVLEQSDRLFQIDQKNFEHGLTEEPGLLGSEANYHSRLAERAVAQSAIVYGTSILKLQLNIGDYDIELLPKEKFTALEHHVSLLESMKKALANRRDYKMAMNDIERRDILVEIKQRGTWPEINLKASFARNGIGNDFNNAINKISEEDNPEFFTSISFSMPLENHAAESELKQAEYEKAKALLNAKYVERKIAFEIIDQITACETAYERVKYLTKSAELYTQRVAAQEKIFTSGRSDSDTVIRYQDDAFSAQIRSAKAMYDYYESMVELRRREGTLLNEYWNGEI